MLANPVDQRAQLRVRLIAAVLAISLHRVEQLLFTRPQRLVPRASGATAFALDGGRQLGTSMRLVAVALLVGTVQLVVRAGAGSQ